MGTDRGGSLLLAAQQDYKLMLYVSGVTSKSIDEPERSSSSTPQLLSSAAALTS